MIIRALENMHVMSERRNNVKIVDLGNGEDNSVVGTNVELGEKG